MNIICVIGQLYIKNKDNKRFTCKKWFISSTFASLKFDIFSAVGDGVKLSSDKNNVYLFCMMCTIDLIYA